MAGAIAERRISRLFADTKTLRSSFSRLVPQREECRAFVRAVAERLFLTQSTGAPPIDPAAFDRHFY